MICTTRKWKYKRAVSDLYSSQIHKHQHWNNYSTLPALLPLLMKPSSKSNLISMDVFSLNWQTLLDCPSSPIRLAPWTGQTLGNAIFPGTADLPVRSLWFASRHHDSRTDQLQPVEQLRVGTTEWCRFAGFKPMEWQQDQSEDAEQLRNDTERRSICQELLCDVTVLCSEQSDQCGLWQCFSQHRLWKDLLHLHYADWRWAKQTPKHLYLLFSVTKNPQYCVIIRNLYSLVELVSLC